MERGGSSPVFQPDPPFSNAIAARVWHLMNLHAGTDMQRLRMQVGALDREVRRLSLQLDRDSRKPD